ncbi:MAG: EAL domain-containing protein [Rhodocyclaceae bacterium]|jgi:diguanylate cyclase (GGDEF)-like protein|nr:EAL domain-containing protein [Rhodocyclaceae bacterium]
MNLSIRHRLSLSFALLLALLLAVSAVALQRFNALTAGMHEFVDHEARIAFLAQRANQHAQEAALHLLRLLQTPTRDARVPLYASMDAALAASDAALGGLERAGLLGGGDGAIRQLVDLRTRYGEAFQTTVELIEIEGLAPARTHFDAQTDALLKSLLAATLELAGRQQDIMQTEVARLEADAAQARTVVLALALAALLAGIALAALIARSIVRPVEEAVSVAGQIAEGCYDCTVPAGRGREMQRLMGALDTMRARIASRERHIRELAYGDSLTGLPNRNHFLEQFAERLGQPDARGALLLLDLDRFAAVNNALGPEVGDHILRAVAERLQASVAPPQRIARSFAHFIARLGADEFAFLVDTAERPALEAFARQLLDALHPPIEVDGQRLDIEARIGLAVFPADGLTATALLGRAERALDAAKRRHSGHAFGGDLPAETLHEQLGLIGEMRAALAESQFVVHFQPKMALDGSGRIKGAEALLRWQHPHKGLVPPGRFIPFAEQTGFIREITPWLVRTVIDHAAAWRAQGLDIVASANLSTLDLLDGRLIGQIRDWLAAASLPPERLCLEITESALMDDPDLALKHLDELAALGIKLSIDDYGSGQASLAYVKNLPVHELKIDRAFVDGVDRSPKNAAIVRSTVLLCRELGLSVVAEGAETPAELDWLAANGCDVVQGYGVAKPMPAAVFPEWVVAHEQRTISAINV